MCWRCPGLHASWWTWIAHFMVINHPSAGLWSLHWKLKNSSSCLLRLRRIRRLRRKNKRHILRDCVWCDFHYKFLILRFLSASLGARASRLRLTVLTGRLLALTKSWTAQAIDSKAGVSLCKAARFCDSVHFRIPGTQEPVAPAGNKINFKEAFQVPYGPSSFSGSVEKERGRWSSGRCCFIRY